MIRNNRTKFALLAGAVLAVTAGSVAFGAVDAPTPPAPPAPPSPPAPPAPPAPPEMARQIVIVEKQGGDDGKEYVRTIMRDGKTFVFQTDRPLSDAEVEQRVAAAEARIPPIPPVPPVPPLAGHDHRVMKQRVIVLDDKGEGITDVVTEQGDEHCKGKDAISNVDTSAEENGKLTRVRIRMCGTPGEIEKHAMAQALKGVREAREEIARDKSLSDSIRKGVLRELDAEIERLGREG